MDFQKTTLKNGLRVVTIPMPSMESATVQISLDAGSRDEPERVNGLAHFSEHMVFKGTKKYPSAQAVSSAVDSIGAEINANTGQERTVYFIKAWERHLPLAFDILADFVKAPLLDPREIEREKGVILAEIAMYNDLPMRKVEVEFIGLLYQGLPLGLGILGVPESVKRIKKEDFLKYRKKLYAPQSMVLSVGGRFDRGEVLKLAEKYFGDLGKGAQGGAHKGTKKTVQVNATGKPRVKLVNKKTDQAHFILGVYGNPLGHPDRYKEAVLSSILGGGMSSRLFTEVRVRRGLAYYVNCDVDHLTDNGYLAARAGVKLEKTGEAIKVVLGEFSKMRTGEVGGKELKKAKEYLKGQLALGLEDTHAVADFFGDQELFEKKIRSVEEIMEGIDKVKGGDIQTVAREFFVPERLNLAIIGPFEDKGKFEKLLKI